MSTEQTLADMMKKIADQTATHNELEKNMVVIKDIIDVLSKHETEEHLKASAALLCLSAVLVSVLKASERDETHGRIALTLCIEMIKSFYEKLSARG